MQTAIHGENNSGFISVTIGPQLDPKEVMVDSTKIDEAHLLILSLNTRTGNLQKGSKQTERWDTSHSTLLNSLLQHVQDSKISHTY